MAVSESGSLGGLPSADDCSAHPELSKRFGLDSISKITVRGTEVEFPAVKPVRLSDGTDLEIYRHPELYKTDTVECWKVLYNTRNRYGTRLDPDEDFHPCYLEAEELFENFGGRPSGRYS